jgi:hypothetical protein
VRHGGAGGAEGLAADLLGEMVKALGHPPRACHAGGAPGGARLAMIGLSELPFHRSPRSVGCRIALTVLAEAGA